MNNKKKNNLLSLVNKKNINKLNAKTKILIVNANYYEDISLNLINGASNFLSSKNVNYEIVNVPGALEIGKLIQFYCEKDNQKSPTNSFDGYIALGCVIKGETYHFEIVSNESARYLSNLSLKYSCIISNGILTVYNKLDALKRSDINKLNKGKEAASACLSLIEFKKKNKL